MQGINYNDLGNIYKGVYTQVQAPQMVDDDEEDLVEEEPFEEPQPVPVRRVEEKPMFPPLPEREPMMVHTVFDDPARDLLKTVAGFALGVGIAKFLTTPYYNDPGGDDGWARGQREMIRREREQRGG
jgi:hypothetical protein